MSWSLTYRATSEESDALIILIALHWAADAWKIFLFSRQLSLASNALDVPPMLRKRMSTQDYDVARRKSIQSSTATISSVAILLLVKTFKLYFGYHFFIWEFTADQAETKFWRAILYAAYDELFSMLIALPFSFFEALMYSQLPISAMIIVSFLEIVVTTIFSAATIACFMMIIENCGPGLLLYFAPLCNAIALFVIAVYVHYFVPQIYLPMENEGPLRVLIKRLTTTVGYPFHKVYVDPDSNASPNAYFMGVLGTKMIALTRSLINMLNPKQVTAVVAHELGHWSKQHTNTHLLFSILEISIISIGMANSYDNETLMHMFGFGEDKPQAIITLYLWLTYISPLISGLMDGVSRSLIGRLCEFHADDFAQNVEMGPNLRSALLELVSKSKNFPILDPLFSAWYDGYPTIFERVDRIESH